MKIVVYRSGLGNQLFFYLLGKYFEDKGEHVYMFTNKKLLSKHNGLEVNRFFDVVLPDESIWSNLIANTIRVLAKFFPQLRVTDKTFREDGIYYDGDWQNKKYFGDNLNTIKFRKPLLAQQNKKILEIIKDRKTVSLHVRRGDYLDPVRADAYTHSCTERYYENAVAYACKQYDNPLFVIFSDDMDWVKNNLVALRNVECEYVDWNKKDDSYLDMYLMSMCNASIIANSSFSYWGAVLNKKKDFVIRPSRWIKGFMPNIFLDNFIAIEG